MSAPVPGLQAAEQSDAETLLNAFKTIAPEERQKHEAVLNYWLSIRGNRELPPLRDLDPLEISDAGPASMLLELLGGGEDAEIRHLGEQLRTGEEVDKISQASRPSLLASVARKLSIVAVSRNFLAFEDEFAVDGAKTRCWVTMLPLSSAGAWVDYVYAYVSTGSAMDTEGVDFDDPVSEAAEMVPPTEESEPNVVPVALEKEQAFDEPPEPLELEPEQEIVPGVAAAEEPVEDILELGSMIEEVEPVTAAEPTEVPAQKTESSKTESGFSFEGSVAGFYATKATQVKPTLPQSPPAKSAAPHVPAQEQPKPAIAEGAEYEAPTPEVAPQADEPVQEELEVAAEYRPQEVTQATEGSLQSKLTDVRAKADEARMAKLRANVALYEGLSAAYDFALDAEDSPEEYLKIVEAQGLKIQLRAPMRPVVKLAFDGLCDDTTIAQLETVLAWALDQELPRGSLAKHIEEAGGIAPILGGLAKAA